MEHDQEAVRADLSVVFFVLIGVNVVHNLVSAAVFVQQRKVFPVSGREPTLAIPAVHTYLKVCSPFILRFHGGLFYSIWRVERVSIWLFRTNEISIPTAFTALLIVTLDLVKEAWFLSMKAPNKPMTMNTEIASVAMTLISFLNMKKIKKVVLNISIGVIPPITGLIEADVCHVLYIALYIVGISSLNFFVIRAVRAWFKYNIARKRVQVMSSRQRKSTEAALAWFLSYRKWFQPRVLLAGAAAFSLVEVGVFVALALSAGCMPTFVTIFLFANVKLGVFAFTGNKLRNVREGLWIKPELKRVAITMAVGAGITFLPDFLLLSNPIYHPAMHQSLRTLVIQLVIFISLDYPVYLSWQYRRAGILTSIASNRDLEAAEISTEIPKLQAILHDPEHNSFLVSLKQHLVGEFNVESLLFYFAVCDFETFASNALASIDGDGCTPSDVNTSIAERALDIYNEYLDDNAPLEVNISGQKSVAIKYELQSSISNFDQLVQSYRQGDEGAPPIQLTRATDTAIYVFAKSEVLRLLEKDPFVRWKQAVRANGLQEEKSLASCTGDSLTRRSA